MSIHQQTLLKAFVTNAVTRTINRSVNAPRYQVNYFAKYLASKKVVFAAIMSPTKNIYDNCIFPFILTSIHLWCQKIVWNSKNQIQKCDNVSKFRQVSKKWNKKNKNTENQFLLLLFLSHVLETAIYSKSEISFLASLVMHQSNLQAISKFNCEFSTRKC